MELVDVVFVVLGLPVDVEDEVVGESVSFVAEPFVSVAVVLAVVSPASPAVDSVPSSSLPHAKSARTTAKRGWGIRSVAISGEPCPDLAPVGSDAVLAGTPSSPRSLRHLDSLYPAAMVVRLVTLPLSCALLIACSESSDKARPLAADEREESEADPAASGDEDDLGPFEPAAIAPTTPHGFSVRDLLAMQRIADPQPSPDGTKVAFVVSSTDLEANRSRKDIWVVDVAGGAPVRITDHRENDWDPRWSPDGQSVYFLTKRGSRSAIWRTSPTGDGAKQVVDLPVDVANLMVSPDGARLAFSADVFVDCPDLACTQQRLEQRDKASDGSASVHEQLFARHWDTWADGRRSHLFVVPIEGGTPVDLTRGMEADVPSKPFGGVEEVAFSPDGKTVVFSARVAGREEPWSTNFDLYAVAMDGPGTLRNLTADRKAWETRPVFAPDGKALAYLSMERPGYEADRFRIVVRDGLDGEERLVAADWDRSIHDMSFDAAGDALLVTADHVGQTPLFRVPLSGGAPKPLVEEGTVGSPVIAGERIVFTKNDLLHPDELFTVGRDGSAPKQITDFNREVLARAKVGDPEQFSFRGAGGDQVWGWVVKPVDFDAEQRYPVAFLIHGGPQGSFGNRFHYRWNPQVYAGGGYAAVMIDFHGSTGYGQAFTDAIRRDWGGKPLEDLQKGLAAAIKRYTWIDGERVCALGASYGGFMINWIAGNWPDRFRCLVNHDGVFDNRMMYYATEELWFPEWEHGRPHWEDPDAYEKHNPVRFVSRWKTPMLVIHGALDYRVPLEQGLATFTALQRRDIPSRLVVFPDENHWVLKPKNSIAWHEDVFSWLDRWLGADKTAVAR